ncbi:MAG: hypothetical protein LQ349_008664 [Xanthoria aureola]|nr:MAG: hypothetical protein LQ349_008664 [Xanthoria aureola]
MDSAPSSPASPPQLSPPPPPPPTPVPLSPASAARQNRTTIAAIDAQLPFGTTPAERRHEARSQIYGEVPDSEEDPDDELSDDDVEMGEATTMTITTIAPTNRVIRPLPIRTRNRALLGTTPAVLHTNAEASDLEAAPAAESTAWAGDLGGMDLLLPLPTLITTADTTTTTTTANTITTTTSTTTSTTTITTTTSTATVTAPAMIFGGIQLPAIQFPRRPRRAGINFEIFDEEAYLEAQREEEEERRNREGWWGR